MSRPLSIVIDARMWSGRRSGIGNYVAAILRELVPLADGMRFLVLRHPDAREPILTHERVREATFPGETKGVGTVFRMGRAFAGFAAHDLFHGPADIVPLGLRCPFVVTLHDLMWLEAPALASASLPARAVNALWYRYNYGRAVGGARAVIAVSEATRAAIGRVYPEHAHKAAVVHHGVDTRRFNPALAGPRTSIAHLVPPDVRYVLSIGQGSPYKNHDGLVRAFMAAFGDRPGYKLVLVRRFARLDLGMSLLLARPAVRRRVIVLPHVPDDALLTLMHHARIVACPSHYEGFGMTALEAMALGVPVLGSTAPAVQEVTGTAALAADPADEGDLARQLRRLEDDEPVRAHTITAGRARAHAFSWRRAAERTVDIYRRAAA